jgi:hypothetical protein
VVPNSEKSIDCPLTNTLPAGGQHRRQCLRANEGAPGRSPIGLCIRPVCSRQAARFWAVDEQVAAAALQHLEERGILRQTRLGFLRSW